MRSATFNLTFTYLTFNQLLFCLSKYVKRFRFIIFFLALFKLCFLLFSKSLYPLWYSFASSLWLSLYSLLLSLFFGSFIPVFWSSPRLAGCNILCILLEFFLPHSALQILYFVYENLPTSKLFFTMTRVILNEFYFTNSFSTFNLYT